MTSTAVNAFIYENLRSLYRFNAQTTLCIYEPTGKLYIVKRAPLSQKPFYDALLSSDNPHLAKILYVSAKPDGIDVLREYVAGEPLANLLKGQKTLPEDTAVGIAIDICDGLSDIHRLGYVHRDINPNNIIVSENGHAKIIDFGIARSFSREKSSDTTILGTPGYAAPEQFGFSQSDERTDIYALGVLLNVMLTGYLPGEKAAGGRIGRVIGKCIEIDSRARYRNIGELKKALGSGDRRIDRIVREIPGIRSRNVLVAAFAVIAYLFAGLMTVAMFATAKRGELFRTVVAWALILPVPFCCFHNFLGIWDRLSLTRGLPHRKQRTVYIIFGIVSIFLSLLIIGTLEV